MSGKLDDILSGNRSGFVPPARQRMTSAADVFKIPVDEIRPDPDNARKHFDAEELEALAHDLRRHGQFQNCVVWHDAADNRYQLIAGERRWRAAKLAGLTTLTCLLVPRDMVAETKTEIAFAENMSRADLRPVEVARHWQELMARWGVGVRELAARVGVAPSTVSKRLKLLRLDVDTQRAVDAGTIKRAHMEAPPRRPRGRSTRGVHTFNAGVVKLKRGHTLEALAAELAAAVRAGQADNAAA
jgi:ParB/RepB/Spo0J family partition protein